MVQTLIQNNNFNGKYVALKDFEDSKIISEGSTPQETYQKALEKGHKNPVITFIPIKGMAQIY